MTTTRIKNAEYGDFLISEMKNPVFITLTTKQALRTSIGFEPASHEAYAKAYRRLAKGLSKRAYGPTQHRRHRQWVKSFATKEGNGRDTRHHIHMIADRPHFLSDQEFESLIRAEWWRNPWAMEDVRIEPVSGGAAGYCFKEGPDSLLGDTFPRPHAPALAGMGMAAL